jgi:hypothetical protein
MSFHLPTADIQLMSPQSYHQRWGGYSLVGKEGALMNLWHPDGKPSHVLEFQLDKHSDTYSYCRECVCVCVCVCVSGLRLKGEDS